MGSQNSHSVFRNSYSLEKRLKMQQNAQKKGQGYILTILEKDPKCPKYPLLSSNMLLLQPNQTLIAIQAQLKNRLSGLSQLEGKLQAIFLYAQSTLLSQKNVPLNEIYDKFKDKDDGILYIRYSSIQTF